MADTVTCNMCDTIIGRTNDEMIAHFDACIPIRCARCGIDFVEGDHRNNGDPVIIDGIMHLSCFIASAMMIAESQRKAALYRERLINKWKME